MSRVGLVIIAELPLLTLKVLDQPYLFYGVILLQGPRWFPVVGFWPVRFTWSYAKLIWVPVIPLGSLVECYRCGAVSHRSELS